MAIIVTTDSAMKEVSYPRMMIYPSGAIILFTSEFAGTCIKGDDVTPLGHYSTAWGERYSLSNFTGSVTLCGEG